MEKVVMKHPDGTHYHLTSRSRASAITSAEQHMVLLGEDTATITVETAEALPLQIGDTAEIFGKTYTLNKLPQIRKTGDRRLQYTITLEGPQYQLIDVQFILQAAGMSDAFTGPLSGHMGELVACLNRRYGTAAQPHPWAFTIEQGVGAEFKTYDFGGKNCLEALQTLCQDYGTEFEMTYSEGVTTIAIGTAGQVITSLGTFRYGKGGGLYELSRTNVDSSNIVTRLFVFGGQQNLPEAYPYKRLLIDGATSRANSYVEDSDAQAAYGIKENTETFDDIYPKLEEHNAITAVGTGDHAEQFFVVSDFPFDINASMISGTTPKVTMQTGRLAGYRFELVSYNHATKTFRVKPYEDENRMTVPSPDNASFQFEIGDTFLISDIVLPTALVTAAEEQLLAKAQEQLAERKHPKVSYALQLDAIRLARQMSGQGGIVEVFQPGDYIPVQDTDMGIDGNIRITAVSRDILRPYAYKLTLGDGSVQATILTRIISDLQKHNEIIKINDLQDPVRRHNAWRTTQELMNMIFDADGYYTDHIRPKSIETQMLEVGARSQQLLLSGISIEPNYQGSPGKIRMSAGSVTAYALEEGPRTWNLSASTVNNLDDSKAYYVYIEAQTAAGSTLASYLITDAQKKCYDAQSDPLHYFFLLGTLSSPKQDAQNTYYRVLSLTYGETTINGRYIKTGRIMDANGDSFIDLDENKMRLGTAQHCIDYNNIQAGAFIFKGVKLQSTSGDINDIAVYRGAYSAYATYYFGDEVSYTNAGETATYRCIDTSSSGVTGVAPTDGTKWVPIAKGLKGDPGEASSGIASIYEVYGNSASATTEPTTWTAQIPTYDAQKPYLWNALAVLTTDAGATPTYHDKECLGEGVSSIRERYAATSTNSAPAHATIQDVEGNDWQDDMPSLSPTNRWLWNLEIMEYIDGRSKTWTNPALIGHYGADGANGTGITSITEMYGNSSSETTAPADSAWQTTVPAHDDNNPYLWNCIRIIYDDNRGTQYTDKQCLGQGVRSVTEYYKTTTSATAPSTPSPSSMTGWSTTMPSVDSTNRWLWNVELITYLDSRADTCTTPSCIGHYGADGSTGRSIIEVVEQYAIHSNAALPPTSGWQDNTIPTATTSKPYVWNREKIIYSSGSPTYTQGQLMGKDIFSITEQYAVSTSGSTAPSSGWGDYASIASQLRKGRYLWNREVIVYSNGYASTTTTPCCIGYQGTDGEDGTDAAEVQQNLLSDANFQEGIAQNIAIDQGWWTIHGEKVTGIDGKTAMFYDNTEGDTYVEMLNQMLFKLGYVQKIEPGEYYTLSFWAKGTQVDTFFYGASGYQVVNTNNAVYIDGEPEAIHQSDGWHAWVLDENTWVRHTYTFQTKSTVISDEYEKKLLFRVQAGHKAYICMPKLERGLRGTAFSISPNDLTERASTFMGNFDPTKTYTGTGSIRQIVKYNNAYYMTMRTAGNFQGSSIYPTGNGLKWWWKQFDASFENIATGLLFAEEAVIENAVVRKLKTSDATNQPKVQIMGNDIQILDASQVAKVIMTGTPTAAVPSSISRALTGGYFSGGSDDTIVDIQQTLNICSSFTITQANNIVTIPPMRLTGTMSIYNYAKNSKIRLQILLDDELIHQEEKVLDSQEYYEQAFDWTWAGRTAPMSVGTHYFQMKVLIQGTQGYIPYQDTCWITLYQCYFQPVTSGDMLTVSYQSEFVHLASNGFLASFGDSSHLLQAIRDTSTNKVKMLMRGGGYGVEIDENANQMYFWINNTKYKVSTATISGNLVLKLTI